MGSEEYYPYGSTAWRAPELATISKKRYRFTGMERDEESGLQCHGRRYYAPWLGRWTSADPIGLGDGVNRFEYCHGNPVGGRDNAGLKDEAPTQEDPAGLAAEPASQSLMSDTEAARISAAVEQIGGVLARGYNQLAKARVGLEIQASLLQGEGDAEQLDRANQLLTQNATQMAQVIEMMANLQFISDGTVELAVGDLNPKFNPLGGNFRTGEARLTSAGVRITIDTRVASGRQPMGVDDLAATLVHELTHARDFLSASGDTHDYAVDETHTAEAAYKSLISGIPPENMRAATAQMQTMVNAFHASERLETRAYANESLFNSLRGVRDNAKSSLTSARSSAETWATLLSETQRGVR